MSKTEGKRPDKRNSHRAKISRKLRVRPSDPEVEPFEEFPLSANVSKRGVYFHTELQSYRAGMRLFVTCPFTFATDPMASEYIAEVLRVDNLAEGRSGIAVRLITTI
jgi:hypothetical protein